MALVQSITVGNRAIDLHKFTGEVVDEKKWSTTHVASSGGGYNVGSGQNNPVTISSTTVTHDQFFLKNESGQEMAIELSGVALALRKGHRITAFWGILQGQPRGPYVAVYNHTTGAPTIISSAIRNLAVPPSPALIQVAWVASVFAVCLYGIGIIALIVLTVTRNKYKRELVAILQAAVDKMVSECAKSGS